MTDRTAWSLYTCTRQRLCDEIVGRNRNECSLVFTIAVLDLFVLVFDVVTISGRHIFHHKRTSQLLYG